MLSLLQKDNLSEWARAYWGNVFDKIALTEERYNARVYDTYKNIKRKEGFISYE